MSDSNISRRAFLRAVSDSARNSLLVLSIPSILLAGQQAKAAQSDARPFVTLNPDEAAEFEAIAARIMPSDGTPGAREAGVIYFMDNVLGNETAETLPALRKGLGDLQAVADVRFGSAVLTTLPDASLDTLLREIEGTPFFATLRYLTMAGMFSDPALGGNRDRMGWDVLGFEGNQAWAPPFGYYDAEYMERGE